MSSQQLNDLAPEELKQHARQVVSEACHAVARAQARVAVAAAAVEATPMDAREDIKAALLAAKETEVAARAACARAQDASWMAGVADLAAAMVVEEGVEEATAEATAEAIANLDILHRQQMMGDWSDDINEAYIQDRIYETRPDVIKAKKDKETQMKKAKKETKEHMGSMLGDWDKAGKLIKRHTSKNRKKTKRRKQKIAKRIKGTKRRK